MVVAIVVVVVVVVGGRVVVVVLGMVVGTVTSIGVVGTWPRSR